MLTKPPYPPSSPLQGKLPSCKGIAAKHKNTSAAYFFKEPTRHVQPFIYMHKVKLKMTSGFYCTAACTCRFAFPNNEGSSSKRSPPLTSCTSNYKSTPTHRPFHWIPPLVNKVLRAVPFSIRGWYSIYSNTGWVRFQSSYGDDNASFIPVWGGLRSA